ncbi:MAG: hypothetical protein EA411_00200 [Saprospirales bacterium]|nr:MAG: hypothetical protein EA411_00200 [Saprospirales bacterium]
MASLAWHSVIQSFKIKNDIITPHKSVQGKADEEEQNNELEIARVALVSLPAAQSSVLTRKGHSIAL